MDPGKAYALALIQKHRKELAKAIVDQMEVIVPEMSDIEPSARVGSIKRTIETFELVVQGRGSKALLDQVRQTVALRQAAGISVRAIMASAHCYLPVIRRVLMGRADDPLEGLRAFEQIEGELLRVLVEAVQAVLPDEGDPFEEGDTLTDPMGPRYTFAPFTEY